MGYRTQSADTSVEVEKELFRRLRALPPLRKAWMLSAANRAARELALAGLRQRYPGADARELRLRLAALTLGREAVVRLFGWDPEREGY